MNIQICRLCAGVSLLWLILSAGVALELLSISNFQLPIAILMGGTVVGIAYQRNSMAWKIGTVLLGMPLAYIFVTNITVATVVIELIILLVLAFALFGRKTPADSDRVRGLQEKMKNCC